MNKTATLGPGRMQWHTGGWFGSQVGGSLFLLLLGIIYIWKDVRVAVVVLVCYLVPNLIGTWLWLRRDRVYPYPAYQILFAAMGIGCAISFLTLDWFGYLERFDPRSPRRTIYLALMVYPGLMLRCYLLEWHSRKDRSQSDES